MKEKIAVVSVFVNAILALGKISVGMLAKSTAILAEGMHSFMDVFSSGVGYLGIKISQRPSDEKHPYGHYKFENLSGALITLLLFITGAGIIREAYFGFLSPEEVKVNYLSLGVMILSALINEIMARLKISYGKKENSVALLSDGFHSRVDVFTSLAVLSGLFLTKYWPYADSSLAVLIGLYVIKESFSIGKEAVDSLVDVSAGEEIEAKIKSIAQEQKITLSSLKTQKKGSVVTANLEIKLPSNLSVDRATKISHALREKLRVEIKNLSYIAIQIKSHDMETGFYQPGLGRGFGWQRRGKFKGEVDRAAGRGPGGDCVCPKCGYRRIHERGVPCSSIKCPNCRVSLERK
jgi:cation diffusion facilitator family transporter